MYCQYPQRCESSQSAVGVFSNLLPNPYERRLARLRRGLSRRCNRKPSVGHHAVAWTYRGGMLAGRIRAIPLRAMMSSARSEEVARPNSSGAIRTHLVHAVSTQMSLPNSRHSDRTRIGSGLSCCGRWYAARGTQAGTHGIRAVYRAALTGRLTGNQPVTQPIQVVTTEATVSDDAWRPSNSCYPPWYPTPVSKFGIHGNSK